MHCTGAVILLAMTAGSAFAQLTVSPDQVKVSVLTDGKAPVTVTAHVNVTAAAAVERVFLEAQPLKGPEDRVIDASLIKTANATFKLEAGTNIVILTIGPLPRSGVYEGSFVLRTAPNAGPQAKAGLSVEVITKPVVTLATDGLSRFTCSVEWPCKLAERWIPAKEVIAIQSLAGGPATIQNGKLFLRSVRGSAVLTEEKLALSLPGTPVNGPGAVISVRIPHDLPADRYQGSLRASVVNGDDALSTPVTLDIRHGPWLAILVLLIGIILGRIMQSVNTPTAQTQQTLFASLAILQSAEAAVRDFAVAQLLNRMLEDARDDIERMIKSEPEIQQELTRINSTIGLAKGIERLRGEATNLPDAKQDLDTARDELLKENLDAAETARRSAQQKILQTADSPATQLEPLILPAAKSLATEKSKPRRRPMVRALEWIAGSQPSGTEVKFALLKPLGFVILIAGLLFVGIYTLYFKNTTFGADLIFDYFSLLTWGLSADVAQRTIQNLR